MQTESKTITLSTHSGIKSAYIKIAGDSDLCLHKMDDPTARMLVDQRKDKAKKLERANEWECVITSMHWRDGKPKEFSEASLKEALKNNAPCISAFGLKKSFCEAVVRNNIDKYSTKFAAALNIKAPNNLIPIRFAQHFIDEKLMSPKRGAPILVRINRFQGWSAEFIIEYRESSFSLEQILEVINLAGFGLGIGSGRSTGYGRYKIEAAGV